MLKIPERFRTPAPAGGPGDPGAGRPRLATQVAPSRREPPTDSPPPPPSKADPAHVALWIRLLLWLIALPVGFVLVFGSAKALGFLSGRQLFDTFVETGWDRFGALLRLLPFWALVTALIVHFATLGLARRGRKRAGRAPRGRGAAQSRREREPERVVS